MSNPFIGEIRMFGGTFAPQGWATCDGQLISIADYSALFALLGTTYGGDGQSTFALPDLRGRLPIHQGQGPGLGNCVIGQTLGVESVTLTSSQIPAHTHQMACNSGEGTSRDPGGKYPAKEFAKATNLYSDNLSNPVLMNASSVQNTGNSQPHLNLMPSQCVNFIIALEGIFPSQN